MNTILKFWKAFFIPNWTIEVYLGLISGIILSFTTLIVFYQFFKEKTRQLLFSTLAWFSLTCSVFFESYSYLYLSEPHFILHNYFFILVAFFIVFFVDQISRESIDPMKLALISAIAAFLIAFSLDPNAIDIYVFSYGAVSLDSQGFYRVSIMLVDIFMVTLFVYYMARIFWNSPKNLKSNSAGILLGAIILGPVHVGIFIFGLYNVIPGLNLLALASGCLIYVIAFVQQPKLAYILPFKALRLSVIEEGGILIYNHVWNKGVASDDILFSGMLHAISQFMEETLNKGDIQEIVLKEAILILQKNIKYPVIFVLIATKPSKSLRNALNSFADRFLKQFAQNLSNPNYISQFTTASDLVLQIFPFVPEYD